MNELFSQMTDINEIKHKETNDRIDKLSKSIDRLCETVENFMTFASNTVPVKVVYIIFILVFGLIFGIEGVRFLFETYLPKFLS